METALAEGRSVDVEVRGKWLPGSIVSIDPDKRNVRVEYATSTGTKTKVVALPNGRGTMRLKRGSTFRGDGVTGKRFPRSQKTHICNHCGERKNAKAFPTDGLDWRLGECRDCRDARTPSGLRRIA